MSPFSSWSFLQRKPSGSSLRTSASQPRRAETSTQPVAQGSFKGEKLSSPNPTIVITRASTPDRNTEDPPPSYSLEPSLSDLHITPTRVSSQTSTSTTATNRAGSNTASSGSVRESYAASSCRASDARRGARKAEKTTRKAAKTASKPAKKNVAETTTERLSQARRSGRHVSTQVADTNPEVVSYTLRGDGGITITHRSVASSIPTGMPIPNIPSALPVSTLPFRAYPPIAQGPPLSPAISSTIRDHELVGSSEKMMNRSKPKRRDSVYISDSSSSSSSSDSSSDSEVDHRRSILKDAEKMRRKALKDAERIRRAARSISKTSRSRTLDLHSRPGFNINQLTQAIVSDANTIARQAQRDSMNTMNSTTAAYLAGCSRRKHKRT